MNSEQRWQRLSPRISSYARSIARRHNLREDEVLQEMGVCILETGEGYDDKNLLIKAGLKARLRVQRTASPKRGTARYFPQNQDITIVSLDESGKSSFPPNHGTAMLSHEERAADSNIDSVEELVCRQVAVDQAGGALAGVRNQVKNLRGSRRQVAELLMAGWKPSEIADRLEMTRPAVSYHIRQLRAVFAPYQSLCALA